MSEKTITMSLKEYEEWEDRKEEIKYREKDIQKKIEDNMMCEMIISGDSPFPKRKTIEWKAKGEKEKELIDEIEELKEDYRNKYNYIYIELLKVEQMSIFQLLKWRKSRQNN